MSVQVALTFNSVDEAIVALGKLVTAGGKVAPQPAAAPQPAEKKERKGRSDAGQPRGPHKKDESNAAAAGGSTTGTSPVTPAAVASTTTGAPAASEPGVAQAASAVPAKPAAPAAPTQPPSAPATTDDVQTAIAKLYEDRGHIDCESVLSRFGVKRGKDLLPDQRAPFIAKVNRVMAGEAI